MRGAWLVLCALSLARGAETPLPAEPELNARWLEGFRRELLRDARDYETEPEPSPSTLGDQIAARRMAGRRSLDAAGGPAVGHSFGKPPARHSFDDAGAGHSSGGADSSPETPEASSAGRSSGKPARQPLVGNSVGQSSGEMGAQPDTPSAGYPASRRPLAAPAASRELGISRRDLYGGRARGSITDQELDAKRQPFLKHLSELDEQMRPVVMRSGSETRQRHAGRSDIRAKSRKRFWDENEQNQDKSAYIIEPNGVKRYKVRTERRERFGNIRGDQPWFKEDWSLGEFDEMDGPDEDKSQEKASDQDVVHEDDRYQESRDDSSSQDERVSVSRELDESEYRQGGLRSRYVQGGRAGAARDYARRFSARRHAALLADGLALSSKPCNCTTDNPQIVPEI